METLERENIEENITTVSAELSRSPHFEDRQGYSLVLRSLKAS